MSSLQYLLGMPADHDNGKRSGITSVCSAHPLVIEATLQEAIEFGQPVLIEATCNQVNQDGGYTGMTPADFRDFVYGIAADQDYPADQILLGGDHLGPNPWRHLSAEQAMDKALLMTRDYTRAGFSKIHLDASMACKDDPNPLPPETIATRSALLAQAAENGAKDGGHPPPAYIIGTEVPVPGGAAEMLDDLVLTTPPDAAHTVEVHRLAFAKLGLDDAFTRAVALVVQPGVEFGSANVIPFQPIKAQELAVWRDATGGILFEAHSTDYQTADALSALVQGGFGMLKVGPGLTFALREALYGLDAIAGVINSDYPAGALPEAMETLMCNRPEHWQAYYDGSTQEQYFQRHFSFSDRIRYYWTDPVAVQAVERLMAALGDENIPAPLISQHMARLFEPVQNGTVKAQAHALIVASIRTALQPYTLACTQTERLQS